LYVELSVEPSAEFTRDGRTINSSVSIPYTDAILGTEVPVATVDGSVRMKIPPGTQPGAKLRLAKKGAPTPSRPNDRGDQILTVNVRLPKNLGGEEKKLIEELAKRGGV
jgi:molecular chaperone DnaJ